MRLKSLLAMALAGAPEASSSVANMSAETMGLDEEEMHAVIGQAVQRYMMNRQGGGGRPGMARRPGMMQRGGYGQGGFSVPQAQNGTYAFPPLPAVGMHPPAKLRSFVGLGATTWGATDTDDRTLSITPQAPIRGERLVIDVVATASALGLIVVRLLQVGVEPQQADTSQPAPASMFAKDVTYGHIAMQVADPGIRVALVLGIVGGPPGSSQSISASAGLFVEWIRGQA